MSPLGGLVAATPLRGETGPLPSCDRREGDVEEDDGAGDGVASGLGSFSLLDFGRPGIFVLLSEGVCASFGKETIIVIGSAVSFGIVITPTIVALRVLCIG